MLDPSLLEESADDLYEHAPCGYFSTLPDATIVKVNETLLAWMGHEREQIVGRRFHDLLAPGDRIYYETNYWPLLQMQGTVREIAVDLVRADGRRLPVLVNSTLRRDADGAPQLVRTTVFDASDRRTYERELLRARADAEARARSALALAHVNEGVVLVDESARVELVNPAAETLLVIAAEEALGKPLAETLPGWAALEERIPVGHRDRWPSPVVLPLERGEHEQWLAVAAVDSGEGLVYTFRDVTDDRRLEELRNDIVTIVSHELRTPLSGTYGAAKTLLEREDSLDEASRRQLLEMVVGQTERLGRILDDMLLTSRIEAGDAEGAAAPVDLTALVHTVVGRSGRKLDAEVEDGVRIRGDATHVEQVLENLLDNARKYSPEGTTITVSLRADAAKASLTVADEGPGIPPGERERIFERFYRLDPDQRAGVGGIGLGLYIARTLVRAMDGRIALVPSERGATFVVELPLANG